MFRKAGILITILSLSIGGIFVASNFINMMQHARVDSEGGTFVYGMGMLFYLTATMLGMFSGSVLWGVGIRKVRENIAISTIEVIIQRLIVVLSTLWIGLVVFKLVANHV